MTEAWQIVAAAVKTKDGVIHTLPAPNRHHHIVHALYEMAGSKSVLIEARGEQGFLLSNGTFADRVFSAGLATRNGQLKKPLIAPPNLYSEDLW